MIKSQQAIIWVEKQPFYMDNDLTNFQHKPNIDISGYVLSEKISDFVHLKIWDNTYINEMNYSYSPGRLDFENNALIAYSGNSLDIELSTTQGVIMGLISIPDSIYNITNNCGKRDNT